MGEGDFLNSCYVLGNRDAEKSHDSMGLTARNTSESVHIVN